MSPRVASEGRADQAEVTEAERHAKLTAYNSIQDSVIQELTAGPLGPSSLSSYPSPAMLSA